MKNITNIEWERWLRNNWLDYSKACGAITWLLHPHHLRKTFQEEVSLYYQYMIENGS